MYELGDAALNEREKRNTESTTRVIGGERMNKREKEILMRIRAKRKKLWQRETEDEVE